MLHPSLFNTILIFPTINILLFFNHIFANLLHLPGSFGFAIISLTVFIRYLLHPFTKEQMKFAKKMEAMKPQLDALTKLHKDDKKKLQEEQMKLHKEMGINPASGCVYAIIQIPLYIALYRVLQLFLLNGGVAKITKDINDIVYFNFLKINTIDPNFFGINLAVAPSHFAKYGTFYLAIPVISAILQYMQIQVSMPMTAKSAIVKKDAKAAPEMQEVMQGQMKFMFPAMIGYLAFIFPVGLSLYWNVFSIFTILQYRKKS